MNAILLLAKLLPLLEIILKEAPELVKDVENLINDVKGSPPATSASADAHAAMDGLEAQLEAPAKK